MLILTFGFQLGGFGLGEEARGASFDPMCVNIKYLDSGVLSLE